MGFFGNRLVEMGVINREQLAEALLLQSDQLVSTFEICHEKQLISCKDLVKAIGVRESGDTFTSTCNKLGFLSQKVISEVSEHQKASRQPLGQIIAETFNIDIASLSEVLDQQRDDRPAQVQNHVAEENVDDGGYAFEFAKVSGETKRQYIDFFSNEIKQFLETSIQKVVAQDSDYDTLLMKLEETLQQLTAAANFARMQISFTLLEVLTQVIEALSDDPERSLLKNGDFLPTRLTVLDVLWELHRFIEVSGDEREFWENNVSKGNFVGAITKLKALL
ncbi:MAG: hypothetical protein HRU19_04860 [Pseudobacteriovorax sp.]|nr:hypothetical protein [Pseudobacteriovorax sp.]